MPITREEFNGCIKENMSGRHFDTQDDRRKEFCITARMCSKGMDREEATRLCNEPKPPKAIKVGGKAKKGHSCEKDVNKITECVITKLVEDKVYRDAALNINSVGNAIAINLMECMCPKI